MEKKTISTFQERGLNCEVIIFDGHYCGYVDVPKSHPFYETDYMNPKIEDLDVHGGVTYADSNGDFWRFGWDAAHAGDYNGIYDQAGHPDLNIGTKRWTDKEAIEETRKLAKQLAEAEGI